MSVKLDWQQDLEDEGWPRRHDYGPPNKGPRIGRFVLIAVVVLLAAGAAVLWKLNQRGLNAVKADVQEAVTYIHWTLQQDDPELFLNTLDSVSPRWVEQGRTEWQRLSDAARKMPDPTIETVSMNGNIAAAAVRWTDASTGSSYLARRWFRLDGTQWLWTQPPAQDLGDLQSEHLAHVTLAFHDDDSEIAPAILPQLDDMVAGRCQQFAVPAQSCHFYLQWDRAGADGQPLLWQDMPLPPLAAANGDKTDAPIYLLNGRQADWQSAELRRRWQEYYPDRTLGAQSSVEMLRPGGRRDLPASLLGDPSDPLVLPSPALEGIDDSGKAHPRWLAFVDRQLTDLVMRQAAGYSLGSADYVNAVWALHQALLATVTGLPAPGELATSDNATPPGALPVEMPDLSGLGAALQSNPDDLAVQQIAGLIQFLQDRWSAEELAALPQSMGTAANLDLLLEESLGVDSQSFTAAWRQQELAQPGSPLAELADTLAELVKQEAAAWQAGRPAALELYSGEGRAWRLRNSRNNAIFGALRYDKPWQIHVDDIGSIGMYVWADLAESDGELAAHDLRFFVKDSTLGWVLHSPVRSYWGNSRSTSGDLVRWSYYEVDEAAVQAVAPLLEDAYRQALDDFGLPPDPITVTVDADTLIPWNFDQFSPEITTASPRSYLLLNPDDDAAEALRREVTALVILSMWQRKSVDLSTVPDVQDNEQAWAMLISAVFAEFEAFGVPTDALLSDAEQEIARALEQDRLAEISELIAPPQPPADGLTSGQVLLAMYVFQRHGFGWLDSALNDGLAAMLDAIMQQQGWTPEDLEADWRAYLVERSER